MDEIIRLKAEMARRQLGAALHMFIEDMDPVPVHSLACGGAELADFLASAAEGDSFGQHALKTFPELKRGELVHLRNKYWNAMKHATARGGKVRDDTAILAAFDDGRNDHILFIGWHDYVSAIGTLPIEAQVLQAWYFAKHPEKLADGVPSDQYKELFPSLKHKDRGTQKFELRRVINWARTQSDVMDHPRTDHAPLLTKR